VPGGFPGDLGPGAQAELAEDVRDVSLISHPDAVEQLVNAAARATT